MVSFMRTETQQEDLVYNKRPWLCAGLPGLRLFSGSLKADLAPPGLTHLALILFSDSKTQPPVAPSFPMSECSPSFCDIVCLGDLSTTLLPLQSQLPHTYDVFMSPMRWQG